MSTTTTGKLQLARLPAASMAVHVTVDCPAGRPLPEAGEHVTRGVPPHASVAVAGELAGCWHSTCVEAGHCRKRHMHRQKMTAFSADAPRQFKQGFLRRPFLIQDNPHPPSSSAE